VKLGNWVAGPSGEKGPDGVLLPGEVHEIRKEGRKIRQGGTGTVWFCSCPQGDMYPVKLCRHLKRIIDFANKGELPPQLRLTAAGRRAAERCGCIKAAKAGKAPKAPPKSWAKQKK